MRKILSTMLTVIMILCSFSGAFAFEGEEYNSLKLPVINEVREESLSEAELFGTQEPMAVLYSNTDSVLTVTGIPMQTEKKGEQLIIRCVTDYLSNADEVIDFYNNCSEYSVVFEYERNGKTSYMYYSEQAFGNIYIDDDAEELIVPVPYELENGKYNVKVHQLNNIWDYRDGGYSELVFEFVLNVTDADETITYHQSLNKVNALNEDYFSMVEGDFGDRPEFTLIEELPGEAYMTGFAIGDSGNVYPISGYCDGSVIECEDEFNVLPAGNYECYYYVCDPYYDWDYWTSDLYGPIKLSIGGISFEKEYYHNSMRSQWTSISMGASTAGMLPVDAEEHSYTLSFKFINEQDEVVICIYDVAVHNLYLDSWNDEIYGGEISFTLNLLGFDAGTYTADVLLSDEEGNSYGLGYTGFNVTDKTVIDNIRILNYSGRLAPTTDSFYVCVSTLNMFTDCDKFDINLVDSYGNVVAETVSKEIVDITSYNGTEMAFELDVTGTLEDDWNNQYFLDIRTDKDVEVVSNDSNVHIYVTEEPMIVRAELVGANTIRFYTENLPSGEYQVVDRYLEYGKTYNTTIDEQGTGTFTVDEITDRYLYFELQTSDGEYIDSFDVRTKSDDYQYDVKPEFIAVDATRIDNFYVEAMCMERDAVEQYIEYAHVTQNGNIIAAFEDIRIDHGSWSPSRQGVNLGLFGNLIVKEGQRFENGKATFEIKYKDGFVHTHDIIVADEESGLYGEIEVDNSCYYSQKSGKSWTNYAVGDTTVSFGIKDTNVVSGTVSLFEDGVSEAVEIIDIAELTKTITNDCYYTYNGTFSTQISEGKCYDIVFEANDESLQFYHFTYLPDKLIECNHAIPTVFDDEGYVYFGDWLNISDIKSLTFRAINADGVYDVPVKEYYCEDDYIDYYLDFSSVPEGYFTLKVFDASEEVRIMGENVGYKCVDSTKIIIDGIGWKTTEDKKDILQYNLYGMNFDTVDKAAVKVYKIVDFPENDSYSSEKLEYVKDVALAKPYEEHCITLETELLSDLEAGRYVLVYMLDDKPVESINVYLGDMIYTPSVTLGDANGDGEVDFADAIIVLKHDAGVASLTGDNLKAADVNADGEVDFADAILILKYDSGLISSFK